MFGLAPHNNKEVKQNKVPGNWKHGKKCTYLPGKNPGEYLWNDTDITLEVKEKASSTPTRSKGILQ